MCRCCPLVVESHLCCKFFELLWVKWWAIVGLHCLRDLMCCEDFLQLFPDWLDLHCFNDSTSGYLEYWSVTVTTITYSLLGKGPQKPASTVSHGLSGNAAILAGSVWCVSVAIWQLKKALTMSLIRIIGITRNGCFFIWAAHYGKRTFKIE